MCRKVHRIFSHFSPFFVYREAGPVRTDGPCLSILIQSYNWAVIACAGISILIDSSPCLACLPENLRKSKPICRFFYAAAGTEITLSVSAVARALPS